MYYIILYYIMVKNVIDLFLSDIIENNYNEIIYKSSASDFYKQFVHFCNLHELNIVNIQTFGILVKHYKSIYYSRKSKRYYTIIIQHLEQEIRKSF